ncbi:hypothetical protein KDH83_17065 [Achromobacter sp. Marseille-Q0513]|uniref:hypothetical protein n=1 Tax=Achromobacter sp. Marseille-Q0513 TaxID=2829161 RepID=UPI001B97CD2B|nr:hypothetical protein [Achromobacter sp. Marseille-Q0513]MBR8655016.1 hypothetical protein [Achromobacter sp. Marseille-Q0513]
MENIFASIAHGSARLRLRIAVMQREERDSHRAGLRHINRHAQLAFPVRLPEKTTEPRKAASTLIALLLSRPNRW